MSDTRRAPARKMFRRPGGQRNRMDSEVRPGARPPDTWDDIPHSSESYQWHKVMRRMIQQGRPEREILRKIVTRWGVDRTEAQEALRYEMRSRTAKLRKILQEEGVLKNSSSDPVAGWVRKNKRGLDEAGKLFKVDRSKRGLGDPDWVISFAAVPQKYYWVSVKYDDTTDSYTGIDASVGVIRGGLDVGDVASSRNLLRLLNRLLKAALKAKGDRTVRVKRERLPDEGFGSMVDPYGGYEVYVGPEMIGKVWKGMDKKWHSSLYGAGYGYRFNSKKDAVDDLIEGGYKGTAKSRGQRNPYFE